VGPSSRGIIPFERFMSSPLTVICVGTVASHIYFDVNDFVPKGWPWFVIQGAARIVVACLLTGFLTAIIFRFKKA
jgi:hypothetical protein